MCGNDLITGLRQIKKHAFSSYFDIKKQNNYNKYFSSDYIVFMILKYQLFLKIGTYMDILYYHAIFLSW